MIEEKLTKEELKELGSSFNSKLGMDTFKKVDGVVYKLCTKCKQYKPMNKEYFPHRSNVKCGFDSRCKDCYKEKEKNRIRVKPFNDNGELYCLKCKLYKPLSEFYSNSSDTKNRNYYSSYCKSCESERNKLKRENYHSDDPILFFRDLATACRGRAYRSNKFKCTITKEDLLDLYEKQNHRCALSGIEMTTIKEKGRLHNNASIDRINPGGDYSIENIRLVCNHINMMRSNLSDNELIKYCKAIIDYANRI